jgi:hypothetical protein
MKVGSVVESEFHRAIIYCYNRLMQYSFVPLDSFRLFIASSTWTIWRGESTLLNN